MEKILVGGRPAGGCDQLATDGRGGDRDGAQKKIR